MIFRPSLAREALVAVIGIGLGTACILPVAITPAAAHDYRLGDIQIGHIWTKPAEAGANAKVYVPILNFGHHDATLVSASSAAADTTELRSAVESGEKAIGSVALPAGRPVAMAPWREHIILTGLKHAIRTGDSFELTLDFGEAGTKVVDVEVESQPSD